MHSYVLATQSKGRGGRHGDAIIVIEEQALTYAIDHHRFAHMYHLSCSTATGTGNFPYAHIPAINF